MRDEYTYDATNCLGGINEQANKATRDQCADARNMWAFNGLVEQRPGFIGVASIATGTSNDTGAVLISEDTATDPSTFVAVTNPGTLTLSGFDTGDRWYIVLSSSIDVTAITGIQVWVVQANSNAVYPKAEYWDGTAWRWLIVSECGGTDTPKMYPHLSQTGSTPYHFAPPADWSVTTVSSATGYPIRFLLEGSGATELDASVEVDNGSILPVRYLSVSKFHGLFVAKFPSTKRYLDVSSSSTKLRFGNQASLFRDARVDVSSQYDAITRPLATMAVVPEFDEAYIAYANNITVHEAYPSTTAVADDLHARVESDVSLVGTGAKYDPAAITQLGEFPAANLITFFKGQLWAADIANDPHGVRWSAVTPAYRVWPSISRETLAENDNSKTKALYGFGENMLVWKNDSMWQMAFTGFTAQGLTSYAPTRVPGAVGCASQASVVEIHGKVYWLAEDGVYSFDGVEPKPLFKDRIQSVFRRINPSRRAFAAGVDWPTRNYYLLSVALDGSDTNNAVLAFDYENDAWWIWDGLEVQFWLLDEDTDDNEALYFGDSKGRIYEFGKGLTDHGATIESYLTTRRFARVPRGVTKTARLVNVEGSNLARSLSVSVIPDDAGTGSAEIKTQSRDFTDPNEVEYSAAVASSTYVSDRPRTRRAEFRTDCRQFRAKVSHSTKNSPFSLASVEAGYLLKSRRR